MITALTDPSQLPNQLQDQQTFDANMAYVIDMLPERARQENELAANMSMFAAGGAYAFPYVFDSSTADSDPGLGKLRLSNTTQTGAATLRMDVQIVGGVDISNVFADLRAATSAVKGSVRLVKMNDPSKWAIFDVSAVALPVGYRNLSVVARASSAVNPFTNGDALMVYIDRNGDSGTVPGATELMAEMVIPQETPVSLANFLNAFDSAHDWYFVHIALTMSGSTVFRMRAAVGGAVNSGNAYWSGGLSSAADAFALGASTTLLGGVLDIGNVNSSESKPLAFSGNGNNGSNLQFTSNGRTSLTAPLTGFQISIGSTGTFYGTIRVYGARKA